MHQGVVVTISLNSYGEQVLPDQQGWDVARETVDVFVADIYLKNTNLLIVLLFEYFQLI